MKKIFAKLKNDQSVMMFNDAETESLKDLYKIPNVSLAIPFEVATRPLAEGEWYFVILTEEQKEEMLGAYVSESGSMVLNPISVENYPEVAVIYAVSGEEKLFTKVTSRMVSAGHKFLAISDGKPVFVEQQASIRLTGEVDAYWTGTRLYFKKFTVARTMFPGMHKIHRQMTEQGTNEFLSSVLFELKEEMSSDIIGLRNRQKIVGIVEGKTIDLKDAAVCSKYLHYAEEYNLDLEIADGKIMLIDNADINKVINLLGESFYTTQITGEKREIKTSKKLVHGPRKRAK